LVNDRIVVPSNVGKASMPDYAALSQAGVTRAGGSDNYTTWAGQAEDPFFLDLRVFDLLYGGDFSETGDDTLAGFNVNSVALQVPRRELANKNQPNRRPKVGIWTTTDRKGTTGGWHQISRLGMPLVNEVVIPLKDKDRFNASRPKNDGQFLRYVTHPELPKLIEAVYGVEAPAEPRDDLVSVFLTGIKGLNMPVTPNFKPSEQLRLNMNTPPTENPNRLGVIGGDNQGYPNGRRLADDVIDISLQVVMGELVGSPNDLGDGVDGNDAQFRDSFPYLALPASGSNADPHPSPAAAPPAEGSGSFLGPLAGKEGPATALGLGLLAVVAGAVGFARTSGRGRTAGTVSA
jgi:hypothetical protein